MVLKMEQHSPEHAQAHAQHLTGKTVRQKNRQAQPRPHIVKSASRTLQLLELFDEVQRPLNIAAVSDALGYPQSSASALLRSLAALGYLEYHIRSRTYMPTERVPLLGLWVGPALFGQGPLLRLVNRLAQQTNHCVLLAARNGDHVQYIHVLNPQLASDYRIQAGDMRPLARTATGHCLLSTMNDKQIGGLFHRLNSYVQDRGERVRLVSLAEEIEKVRTNGFAVSLGCYRPEIGMVAALLPERCTNRALALGIGGGIEVISERATELASLIRSEVESEFGPCVLSTQRCSARHSAQG
jgi:DNA-binding IclR family transcriptional regulator